MKKILLFYIILVLVISLFSCQESEVSQSPDVDDSSLTITVDSKEYSVGYNLVGDLNEVVIYDREFVYVNNGSASLDSSHNGRKIYKVIIDENNNFIVKESLSYDRAFIPVNGILISFKDPSVELKYNSSLTIENYDYLSYETGDYTTFTVNGERRRIYLKNPDVDLDENIIAFITSEYGKDYTLKDGEVAYSIIREKSGAYFVGERIDNTIEAGNYALVFTGEYNISFAEVFMIKDEKINFKSLNSANSSVYLPSISIDDSIYTLSNHPETDKEGIYLFDCDYEKYATPKFQSDFISVVINNNKISYVGELNEQLVLPNNNDYVIVFVGDKNMALINEAKNISTLLITPTTSKDSDLIFEYSTFSKGLNAVNAIRETNNLIVYTPSYGKTTKTNEWGCEIAVDKDGFMVDFSSAGNMTIPEGGFVISSHGDMNDWLKEIYLYGSKVVFDQNSKKITITVTPLATINSVKQSYEIVKTNYEKAISTYRDFDVETLDSLLSHVKDCLDKTNDNDLSIVVESIIDADKTIKSASELYFSSSVVENRAVWYAPTERNEAEVRKTIELIKSLNFNALYIETWRSGQTNYKTNLDMTFHEATYAGFDVLEAFVRIGHENGIEIHAWVHDFFVGTDYHMGINGHVLNLHPEWALETRSGSVLNPTEYGNFMFLNPFKRECRDFVLSVYREILENYDVDGLHLDYIRFPEPNASNDDWGYNDDIIAAFQAKYNTTIDPHFIHSSHSLWDEWCKFREDIITSFVGEVYDMVQEVNSDIWLSAAIYPNMAVTPKSIFQNFVPWVENGWMDEIFAMSYSSSADTVIDVAENFLNAIKGKCFYSAGIGAFAQYDDVAYLEQIEYLRDTTAVGSNIFSLASVNGNNLMKLLQQTVYRNEAIQVYDTKSVYSYIQSMIDRCDGVYKKSDLNENDLKDLADVLSATLDKIEAVDLSDSSRLSKKLYFEQVKPFVQDLDVSFVESKDTVLYSALLDQIDSLIEIIDTNINIFS